MTAMPKLLEYLHAKGFQPLHHSLTTLHMLWVERIECIWSRPVHGKEL
jgi:hypothetical protein